MVKKEDIVFIKPLKRRALLVSFPEVIYTNEKLAYCIDDDGNELLVKVEDLVTITTLWDKVKEKIYEETRSV